MKKLLLLTCCAAVLSACAATNPGINTVPAKLTAAIKKADKSCQVDADCVAVQKGCCMCAGYEAVNKNAAAKVESVFEKQCASGACTREMCYVQIEPICKQNVCTGNLILPKGQN